MEYINDIALVQKRMPLFSPTFSFSLDYFCPKCRADLTYEFLGAWATVLLENIQCPICNHHYLKLEEV